MKKLIALLTAAIALIIAFPQTIYAEYIGKGVHEAYIYGYPDGTIRPEESLTREEAASMLFAVFKESLSADGKSVPVFADVPRERWSFQAVNALYANGALSGNEGKFRPDDKITRAEMASVIYRLADYEPGTKKFTDIDGHWAQKAVENTAARGWLAGYTDGTFRPDGNITRAEAVFLINGALDRRPESEDALLNDMKIWTDNTDTGKWYYIAIQEASNSHEYSLKDNGYEIWDLVTDKSEKKEIRGYDLLGY